MKKSELAYKAKQAAIAHKLAIEKAAMAALESSATSFGEKTRARIILKRIKKGQPIH